MKQELELIDADCLLRNLRNGIELIVSSEEKNVGLGSLVVRSVAEILTHGLKDVRPSFWHVVRELTHSSTRQALARSLRRVHDNYQRGLFWIYYTLIEGSLDSYMHCLVTDKETVDRNYVEEALVRDQFCATKFVLLLTSLSQHRLNPLDSTACVGLRLDIAVSYGGVTVADDITSLPSTEASSPADSGLHDSMENLTPIQENAKPWPSESTLTPQSSETAFSDGSLSSSVANTQAAVNRRQKRVSFHETVTGDGPKGTVWERRSCDVESTSWWKHGTYDDEVIAGEKGQEALDMERGVPEGSDDPQSLYAESRKPDGVDAKRVTTPSTKWRPVSTGAAKWRKKRNPLDIYPGPRSQLPVDWTFDLIRDNNPVDSTDIDKIMTAKRGEVTDIQLIFERLYDITVERLYKLMDEQNNAYYCGLTHRDIRLIHLGDNKIINTRTIPYQCLKLILVGPSPEHVSFITHKSAKIEPTYVLTSRGEDFCSWLHHLTSKNASKCLDFITISPEEYFSAKIKKLELPLNERAEYSSWAVLCEPVLTASDLSLGDHLMFSVGTSQKYWDPAYVEIKKDGFLEIRPHSAQLKKLRMPLKDCVSCGRLSPSARPHTFQINFSDSSFYRVNDRAFTVCIAASDDQSTSNWLEALLLAVASCKEQIKKKSPTDSPPASSNAITGHHLILSPSTAAVVTTTRFQLVRRTPLRDIASILTGPSYLIFELDCHEVEDKATDWTLHFFSDEIKNHFLDAVLAFKPSLSQAIFDHKLMSSDWYRCELERNRLDEGFEAIRHCAIRL